MATCARGATPETRPRGPPERPASTPPVAGCGAGGVSAVTVVVPGRRELLGQEPDHGVIRGHETSRSDQLVVAGEGVVTRERAPELTRGPAPAGRVRQLGH